MISFFYQKPYIIIFIILFSTKHAFAASPISAVSGTTVNKGQTSIESRFGYITDDKSPSEDKRFQMRQHIDYGFTDWYAFRITNAQDKINGNSLEHDRFTLEQRFHLIKEKEHGWNGGIRLTYVNNDGDKSPNEFGGRFIADIPFMRTWRFRHNSIFRHDIGVDSKTGTSLSLRHQIIKEINPEINHIEGLDLGLSLFSDFGKLNKLSGYSNQDHELRPTIKASFTNDIFIKIGLGFGISHASPDQKINLFIGKSF